MQLPLSALALLPLLFALQPAPQVGPPDVIYALDVGEASGDWSTETVVPVRAVLRKAGGTTSFYVGLDYVDLFLFHSPNDGEPIDLFTNLPQAGGVHILSMEIDDSPAEALAGVALTPTVTCSGSQLVIGLQMPNGNPLPYLDSYTTLLELRMTSSPAAAPAGLQRILPLAASSSANGSPFEQLHAGSLRMARHFVRGDANFDGTLDLGDAMQLLGGSYPPERDAADANDDGAVDIADASFVLSALFTPGAPLPAAPFPAAGPDPTADNLPQAGAGATGLYSLDGSF